MKAKDTVVGEEQISRTGVLITVILKSLYEAEDNITEAKKGDTWIYKTAELDGIGECLTALGIQHTKFPPYERLEGFELAGHVFRLEK